MLHRPCGAPVAEGVTMRIVECPREPGLPKCVVALEGCMERWNRWDWPRGLSGIPGRCWYRSETLLLLFSLRIAYPVEISVGQSIRARREKLLEVTLDRRHQPNQADAIGFDTENRFSGRGHSNIRLRKVPHLARMIGLRTSSISYFVSHTRDGRCAATGGRCDKLFI